MLYMVMNWVMIVYLSIVKRNVEVTTSGKKETFFAKFVEDSRDYIFFLFFCF